MIYPMYLVILCTPAAIALLIEWRANRNKYVLCALLMTLIFMGVYAYIGVFDPPIEKARETIRRAFVAMWSFGAGFSVQYLAERWKNRHAH